MVKDRERKKGLVLSPQAVCGSPNSKRRRKLGRVKLVRRFEGRALLWFRVARWNGARVEKWVWVGSIRGT